MKLLVLTQKVDENDQLLGFFIPWLERFAKKFESVLVLCLQEGAHALPPNVRVVSLGKERGFPKALQLSRFWWYCFKLRNQYDAVFVHMNPIWVVVGASLWHRLGKKVSFWYTHKAVTVKLRLAEKLADVIFTASPESFRIPSKKVIVTGHGIDTELFKPDPAVQRLPMSILTVGRIAPVKNYDVLMNALKLLADQGLDFSVTIVGEPALAEDHSYAEQLKKRMRMLGLADRVVFLGKKQNRELISIYRSHDIFVHMSKTGSVDKALLEAMACGMKVISSNDAARGFLPEKYIVDEDDAELLMGKMVSLGGASVDLSLREYVVRHHNLNNLVDKIKAVTDGK